MAVLSSGEGDSDGKRLDATGKDGGGSDSDSFGDELEGMLADSDEEAASKPKQAKRSRKGAEKLDVEAEAEEEAELARMRESGFTGGNKKGKPKLEASAGARRLRRTIKWTAADGGERTRQVIVTKREVVAALHALYAAGKDVGGLWGFGTRHIKGRPAKKGKKKTIYIKVPSKRKKEVIEFDSETSDDEELHPEMAALTSPRATKSGRLSKRKRMDLSFGEEDSEAEGGEGEPDAKRAADGGAAKPALQKAPSKRTETTSGRGHLNNVLRRIVTYLRNPRNPYHEQFQIFQDPVSAEVAPDYNDFVPIADEMILPLIERAARNWKYNGRSEFRRDVELIAGNAAAYNTQGKYAFPPAIEYSKILLAQADSELLRLKPELDDAEERLFKEEGVRAPALDVAIMEAAAAAEAQASAVDLVENWVQCSRCNKWRRLSDEAHAAAIKDDTPWFCENNPDAKFASCDVAEETEAET